MECFKLYLTNYFSQFAKAFPSFYQEPMSLKNQSVKNNSAWFLSLFGVYIIQQTFYEPMFETERLLQYFTLHLMAIMPEVFISPCEKQK